MSPQERRQYFRTADKVWLRLAPANAAVQPLPTRLQALFALVRRLQGIQHEQQDSLLEWKDMQRPLQRYLRLEQQKIELLMQFGLREYLGEELPSCDVVLSGNGLRCSHPQDYATGTTMQLQLVLFPEWQVLQFAATVQRCEKREHAHELSLHFIHVQEEDRDILLRHNTQLQSRLLREKHQGATP